MVCRNLPLLLSHGPRLSPTSHRESQRAKEVLALEALYASPAYVPAVTGGGLGVGKIFGGLALLLGGGLLLGGDTPQPEPEPPTVLPPLVTEPEPNVPEPDPEPQLATDGAGARDGGDGCNNYGDNRTRRGVRRTTNEDWVRTREVWDQAGIGEILSASNRWKIDNDLSPVVDSAWIRWFPEHAGQKGETIVMHHVDGNRITVPLPTTRHNEAHQPGGTRYNPGGPGVC